MVLRWMRLTAALVLCALSLTAAARPFGVDDLLRTEGFGAVAFDPSEHWLVVERLVPFSAMRRFDMLGHANILRAELYRVDLHAPWRAKPLLADSKPGTILYGFSTNGCRLAIGRLSGDRWQLGIVTMATGAVRWFDLSPDYTPSYTTLRWISDRQLAVIAVADRQRPWWLRADSVLADQLPARWAATRSGKTAAVTAIGSGRFHASDDRGSAKRLMLLDVASGRVTSLASGHFLTMALAPDRASVALIAAGPDAPLASDRAASQIDWPYRERLLMYDLRRRALWQPCRDCDVLGAAQWSADSRNLAFFARRDHDDWPQATLFAVDVARRSLAQRDSAGIAATLAERADGAVRAAFAWRGADLLLFGHRSAPAVDDRSDWYALSAPGRPAILTANLARTSADLNAIAGCPAAMTADDGLWCLDGPAPRLMFGPGIHVVDRRAAGWHIAAGRMTMTGATLPGRTIPMGATDHIEGVDIAPSGRLILVRRVAGDGIKTLTLVSADRRETIATANRYLRDVDSAVARPLSHTLPDGQTVTSWLYLPPRARPGGRLGLVVIPYPGQRFETEPPSSLGPAGGRFHASVQLLVGHGYAVLMPSLPPEPDIPGKVPGFVADVDVAVDAALATGLVDPNRLALWGHSYGGYAAATIATQSCRYASIIASAGVYDLGAATGIFDSTLRLAPEQGITIGWNFAWSETGQGGLGVPPWVDPARYVATSPYYQADRITTPMLIIGADRDSSPVQQAEELFSALYRQGKDAELLTYWGEGHVVGSPANVRDLYDRVFRWLDETMETPRQGRCDRRGSLSAAVPIRAPNAP